MFRLVVLSLCVLILSGCAATTQELPTPTFGAQPAQPTAPAASSTAVAPTATSRAALPEAARYARFAATWQQANQDGPEATALVYSAERTTDGQPSPVAFWQLPLGASPTPQQMMVVGGDSLLPVSGRLSPDGVWLAYITGRDTPFGLRVARVDGSDNQHVTSQIGLHNNRTCLHTFAWSPTGRTLAFIQHWEAADEFGKAVFVYDPQTDASPREVVRVPGGRLVGWDNTNRILVLVATAYRQPLDLVAFDVATGMREVLLQMPTNETVFCTRMAANHERFLIQLGTQDYLYDMRANQLTGVDVASLTSLWSSDSMAVLAFSGDAEHAARFVRLDGSDAVAEVDLAPPDKPGRLFGIVSASPDGEYIVVCDTADGRIHRSLLYRVAIQQWQIINEGLACIAVAGWITKP